MLLTDTYNTYVTDIIKLVRSFVIKSVQTIDSINSFLTAGGDHLSLDVAQWKYYRNLAGERYIGTSGYFDDPIITVYSLDIEQVIPFTVASMAVNPITLNDFLTYGTSYDNLLAKYPDSDMLIRGVLRPVDIDTAIAADPYTILAYDDTLLGEGETALISDLQVWLNNYTARWNLTAFAVSDTLYAASSLAIIYLNLVPAIINLRFKNCKTKQAHEFHIWNYLAGYFKLHKYKGIIPYQQALFLYRNIDYITANAGKHSTLDFLNSGFAFPFGLQLFNHDIRQDIGESLSNLDSGNYKAITNTVKVNMYPYGTSDQVTTTTHFITPNAVVKKLATQALLNPENIQFDTDKLIRQTLHTPINSIPTGVIECDVIHTSSVNMVSVVQEKIHNWLYLVANKYIQYKYLLNLPAEGIVELSITPADAAVLLMYASAKYFKETLTAIPIPRVRDIMYQPALTELKIKGLVEKKYITGGLGYTKPYSKTWDRYQDVINAQTYPVGILNVKEFSNYIAKIVHNKIQHRILPTLEPTTVGRAEINSLIHITYTNFNCSFVEELNYVDFFTRLGIDLNTFTTGSLLELINIISSVYINLVPETNTLQSPYADMVEILRIVSSYMVQYVEGAATNNIEPIEWTFSNVTSPGKEIIERAVKIQAGYAMHGLTHSVTDKVSMETLSDVSATTDKILLAIVDIGADINCMVNPGHKAAIIPAGAFPHLLN